MSGLPALLCAAVVLAACSQREVLTPRTPIVPKSDRPMFPVSPSYAPFDSAPDPDVDAAVDTAAAAEAAALKQIEAHVPAENWPTLLTRLTKREPNTISIIASTSDPRLSELIARYYEARHRLSHKHRRQQSVRDARQRRVISLVVALGEPKEGNIAEVHRRPARGPREVIVLGPDATPEALGAALAALQQSRARVGDDFEQHLTVSNVPTAGNESERRTDLAPLMEKLRSAQKRHIDGVGTLKAIDILAGAGREGKATKLCTPLEPLPATGSHTLVCK